MTLARDKKRPNLRDVARLADVSVATVSRVLNAPSSVSNPTKERVQAAIDELRFVRSAAARAINSGRTRIVGALVPTLDNAIFARFLDALEKQLVEHQLSLIVATTKGDPDVEATKAQNLIDIGAEGLIVSGVSQSAAFLALTERVQLPVIATSYFDDGYALPTIGYDNRKAAVIALQHLAELGHEHVAAIHGPTFGNDRTRARIDGLLNCEHPAKVTFSETDLSIEGGCKAVRALLKTKHAFSAILCLSDVIAMGALFELQRDGIAVPADMSLIGIDDLPGSARLTPALTTVKLPVQEMGRMAAQALAKWVEIDETPHATQLDVELIIRSSTARPTVRRSFTVT